MRAFLGGLDFLVVAPTLIPHSQGMIGERELRMLPPTAFLLDPSRGPIIQEEPLLRPVAKVWFALELGAA